MPALQVRRGPQQQQSNSFGDDEDLCIMIGGGPFALQLRVLKQGSVMEEAMLTGRKC